jgi:trimeric autotransporter adhesin
MKKIIIIILFLNIITQSQAQNVGINTTTPNATLDVNGDMAMRIASISLNAGINNNVNSTTTKRSAYRIIDPTADFTITGLDGGSDGRVVTLANTSNFIMSLIHESANSTGANRFILANGVSYDVQPKATITLQYSVVENRWFLVGKSNTESADWKLTGNAGTNQYQNFVGTTDNQNLRFRVNNNPSGLIGNNNVSLGQNALKNDTVPQTGLAGNVAIGVNALKVNTVGSSNIAIGNNALLKNINAHQNIAIGDSSLSEIISGFNSNVAVGSKVLKRINGVSNVGIGNISMGGNVTGGNFNRSVVIGDSAMSNTSNTLDNVAIGNKASQKGGSENVSIGAEVMQNNSGGQNVAIGYQSLKGSQNGFTGFNTSVGYRSMANVYAGGYNVAIGHTALENGTNTNNNVAIGYKAENEAVNGNSNISIGHIAHYKNKIGSFNVIMGNGALSGDTAGTFNTAIGHNALSASQKSFDNIAIGYSTLSSLNNFANYDPTAAFGTIGRTNLALGNSAMINARRSSFNTAVGHQSLGNDTSGQYNVAIGYQTMASGIGGDNNVGVGHKALYFNNGQNQVAIGLAALENTQNTYSNVAVGVRALQDNRWNNNIVAIGDSALRRNGDNGPNSGGFSNTAVGSKALSQNITGSFNTAIGFNALRNNSAGRNNVAIGDSAMVNNTASRNIAIGSKTMNANTTGAANIGIGTAVLKSNLVGNNNIAIGDSALTNNTASKNISIGSNSLYATTTGNNNISIGTAALKNNIGGSNNTVIGDSAMFTSTANFNTAIGANTLQANTIGIKNTAIGNAALKNNIAGNGNTAIGDSALVSNTNGGNNTAIGRNAAVGINVSNATAIGANAIVDISNSMVLGAVNGFNGSTASTNVGIGTISPAHKLDVQSADLATLVNFNNLGAATNSNGLAVTTITGTAIQTTTNTGTAIQATTNTGTVIQATSLSGKALVALNNSNTNATVDIFNNNATGTTLKTKGKNIFTGTNYASEFNTGTNEDTYILAGKPAGNVIINNNNNNTIIGSAFSKVGIANTNPQTTLDVFGDVKVGGNIGYGNGIYSDNTYSTLTPGLGLNIIPLGVIRINHANLSINYSLDIAGSLRVADSIYKTGLTTNKRSGYIYLNPAIVSQYSKIIAIGSPQYYDQVSGLNYYLMGIGGEVKTTLYNGTPTLAYYWEVQTDGSLSHIFDVFGDIMFYGLK